MGPISSPARRPAHLSLPLPVRHRRALVPGLAAAALLLAACGSSGDDAQVASLAGGSAATGDTTSTTLSQADTQQAMLDFAACMRENGVNMADPTFDANGNVQGGLGPGNGGVDPRSDEFQAAQEACGDELAGVQFGGPGGAGGFDRTGTQDGLNNFTACLRDEGLQVDDITLGDGPGAGGPGGPPPTDGGTDGSTAGSGGGGFTGGPPPGAPDGGGTGDGGPPDGFNPTDRIIEQLGLDAEDPAVTAAIETCQPVLDQAFTPADGSTSTTAAGA